jgi:hypothetical protein
MTCHVEWSYFKIAIDDFLKITFIKLKKLKMMIVFEIKQPIKLVRHCKLYNIESN